jgi:hypothetical protein
MLGYFAAVEPETLSKPDFRFCETVEETYIWLHVGPTKILKYIIFCWNYLLFDDQLQNEASLSSSSIFNYDWIECNLQICGCFYW